MWHILTSSIKLWNSYGRQSVSKWCHSFYHFRGWEVQGCQHLLLPTCTFLFLKEFLFLALGITQKDEIVPRLLTQPFREMTLMTLIPASSKTDAYFYHDTQIVLSLPTFVSSHHHHHHPVRSEMEMLSGLARSQVRNFRSFLLHLFGKHFRV